MASPCPQCDNDELEDADDPLPEGETIDKDWFCVVCGGLFDDEEVES